MPECFYEVWGWFLELNNSRQSGMSANPLSFSDIYSYFSLYNIDVLPWEIKVIKAFDNAVLKIHADQQEKEQANQAKNK